jgi:hypothetical protein
LGGGGRGEEELVLYDVTFQVGGDERVERVEAPDAAAAVEIVRAAHRGTSELFELIQVHLLDDQDAVAERAVTNEAGAAR